MGDGIWADRTETAEFLGISNGGLILLQRDGILPPDCVTCGRIRWRIKTLEAKREAARQHLIDKYGGVNPNLVSSTR